jgi:integrase
LASIRKRTWTNGKGEKRSAYILDYVDSRQKRRRKQFDRYKTADKFRVKIEGELANGTYRSGSDRVTVTEMCVSYLNYAQGRMERNERMTRKMLTVYRGHINNYILHPEFGLGGHKLTQFTAKNVGDFRDAVRTAGVTVPTTRKILSTLHAIIGYAIGQDWVATNAAHGVRVIGPRDEGSKKIIPPSKDQMSAIITAAKGDLNLMALLAATTGARAGEQWALRWSNVGFAKSELNIRTRLDCYGEEGATKSAAGVRDIPMSDYLIAQLRQWRLKSNFSAGEDYVFANKKGNHICHDNLIKRRYKPMLLEAGVTGIHWHSLRHFAISTWIEAGLSPKTVQTFAGHSSLQITMDRYGHLFPSDDHKAAMDAIARELMG